ncbi:MULTISPECIES: LuxR C-terminal-related transcriptional regulator [unclassified Kitasatospora]|uniref:LuxR C-terminal-related transcriptional regulator n=1 Tax=unclassified Kitasatospora TaxID=2633591 RepID=UPI001AE00982|nr:LuxR C-terminal-related transcriptional regulator [Kitasatospora sp. RG8]MBP0455421.1 helix-turn-helix transcriptional regulator [Kitasatospora sp. RG8]
MLEVLGLGPTAEAVYAALLAEPGCRVTDLCRRFGLSETAVREALDQLADLTLLRPSQEVFGALRPVSPAVGLEAVIRRQEDELARRQQELAASKAAVAQAVAAYADLVPNTTSDATERLVGMDAIQAKLEMLARDLQQEFLAAISGGAQSQASMDAARPLDQDALERGVAMRTLYQDSARNDQATHAYAQWLTGLGGQVRTAPLLPPRLLVFDRHTAVVPIDPTQTRLGALCTSEPGLVASLVALFEQAWSTAVPLGADQPTHHDTGLTPAERDLLRLLGTGLTDEAAGKRLGISVRTVRRQMSALMERLDAASRFEAGLKAAQRGWL